MMARPRVHDEALAEALLEEAIRIVGREGPDALSLRHLTQQAGTSTSAIYSLYGSRDCLLDAVYGRAIVSFVQATAVAPTPHPLADLLRMGLAYRQWALGNPQLYPVMFGHSSKDSPQEIQDRTRSTVDPLLECIRRAMSAGLLVEADPITVVTQLWITVHGFVSMELDGLLDYAVPHPQSNEERYDAALRASIAYWRP